MKLIAFVMLFPLTALAAPASNVRTNTLASSLMLMPTETQDS